MNERWPVRGARRLLLLVGAAGLAFCFFAWLVYSQLTARASNEPPTAPQAAAAITNRSGDQTRPALAYDAGSGTYLAVWQDASGIDLVYAIYARQLASNGVPLGVETLVSSQGTQVRRLPDLAANPNTQRYLVVWELEYSSTDRDVYSRLVGASGSPVYGETGLAISGSNEMAPSVAWNATAGEYIVAWQQWNGSDFDIYARRLNTDGGPIALSFAVATGTDSQQAPDVACSLESAECLVVYQGRAFASEDTQIYAQRTSGSAPTGGQIAISTWEYDQLKPQIAHNTTSDEFLVVWEDHHWSWGAERDLYAQRLNAAGGLLGGNFGVAWDSTKPYLDPQAAYRSAANEYLVTWMFEYSASDVDVYRRRVRADGSLPEGEVAVSSTSYNEGYPAAASDGAWRYQLAWQDARDSSTQGLNIYGDGVALYQFSGRVFNGLLGDESQPLALVTVQLGCSNNAGDPGTVIATAQTDLNGWYGLETAAVCEYYNILQTDLGGYVSEGATSVSGVVRNANWIQYLLPLEGKTLTGNKFWDKRPATPTATATATKTSTITPTATASKTPTATATASKTLTVTPSPTASRTPTATATATKTLTPTASPTSTQTKTPTATATATKTLTPTASPTVTQTKTPTTSPTASPTPTQTLTPTPTNTAVPTPVWIHFEEYSAGTWVKEQYSSKGVHFMSDYLYGQPFRAAAQIQVHSNARSSPNVLVNEYSDSEFSSSANVPLAFWFDDQVAGVGMYLGSTSECSGSVTASVKLYDISGTLRGSATVVVSSSFNTPLEIDDPLGLTSLVIVDYGSSLCPEAIDELAYQPAGGMLLIELTKPTVSVTSHSNNQLVNQASAVIAGTAFEGSGILTSVKVNGQPAQFYPVSGPLGNFKFRYPITLKNGANAISVTGEDSVGYKGSTNLTLYLGVPIYASIGHFHLTQRGLMDASTCDVDMPFVAGKNAIIRMTMPVKTSTGFQTYASDVELKIYRKGQASPVDTLWGWEYSAYTGQYPSPSQYASFTFAIPGKDFDTAGEYQFVFQAYAGIYPIGSPQVADCGGAYLTFSETNPVRFFIMPAEASTSNPNQTSDHLTNYNKQIQTVVRTFPVREGYGTPWWSSVGVKVVESAPLQLCDGSQAMATKFPNICKGTGWTWRLIDRDSSGTLHRANSQHVSDLTNPNICAGKNKTIGGAYTSGVLTDANHTMSFVSSLGIFRSGAHPNWYGTKFYIPIDEDHDGSIDTDDLNHMVSEFFDVQHNQWETNLTDYNPGETVRFFRDTDGDQCNDEDSETQADVITLWHHANTIAFGPAAQAMNTWNSQWGGQYGSFKYSSLWFPVVVNPQRSDFGTWGPGSSKGDSTWIRVTNDQTMAHELGHSIGGLKDTYKPSTGECYIKATQLHPWAAFVDYKSVNVNDVWDVMECSDTPEKYFFNDSNYLALFNALKKTGQEAQPEAPGAGEQFVLSGWIYLAQHTAEATSLLASEQVLTPSDPSSPYHLVFGQGQAALLDYPFAVDSTVNPPEGYDTWVLPFTFFNVTAPFPAGTAWVELRDGDQVLWRQARSPNAPNVVVIEPGSGAEYTAQQEITVRWTSSDIDGGTLLHTIFYSSDNGDHWVTLAAGVAGTEYTWKAANSPGTQGLAGRVRVVASDGFNHSQDENNTPFGLEGKPPQVALLSPTHGASYLGCEPVYLKTSALDPEGGPVTTTLTINGELTAIPANGLLRPLAAGEVELAVHGVDDQGLSASHQVTVTVRLDLDCDGMPAEYEERHALDDSNPEDAGLDLDSDGLINLDEAWYQTNPHLWDTDGDGYSDGEEVARGSDPLNPDAIPPELLFLPVVTR